jgi:hypothetical protein
MENAKKVLFLVCEVGNVLGAAQADDGKIDAKDLPKLIGLWDEITALLSVDVKMVLPELKAMLSPEQYGAVMAEVAAKFDIPNDDLESKIENTISGVGFIVQGATQIIGAWKK